VAVHETGFRTICAKRKFEKSNKKEANNNFFMNVMYFLSIDLKQSCNLLQKF
jgi:hypothetical protein